MRGARWTGAGLAAVLLAAGLAAIGAGAPAAADTALVDYTCDLPAPSGVSGALAGEIPDTAAVDDLEVTIVDTPDPVVSGHPVHYDLDLPVLDPSAGFPPAPPELGGYGIIRFKYIELTSAIPAGLSGVTATFEQQPPPSWATLSQVGGNLKVRVQSPVTGSYIEVNPDVTPPTIRIQTAPGVWANLTAIPAVDIDATATAAAGSSIVWTPPTLFSLIKYSKSVGFGLLLNVNWNDANLPCTPNDPNQVVVSTLVEAPAPQLSVTTTADAAVQAGETVDYEVTVANTGNVALSGVAVTAGPSGCTGVVGALEVGASSSLTCSRATTAAEVGALSATATADAAETEPVTSAAATTQVGAVPAPSVTLTGPADPVEPGATIDYDLTIRNDASVLALTGLEVTSDDVTCDPAPASLAAGATAELGCRHVAAVDDIGDYAAVVTVGSAEAADGVSAAALVTVGAVPPPLVELVRDPADAVVAPGATVDYTLTVAEQGLVPLTDLVVEATGATCAPLVAGTAACTYETRLWDVGAHEASATVDATEIDPVTAVAVATTIRIPEHGFTDVPPSAWYGDGVAYARFTGVVGAGARFRPADAAVRSQVADMTWRFLGRPTGSPRARFTDVPATASYRRAVDWVVAQRLMSGSGGRFRPAGTLTRCQYVLLTWKLAGSPTGAPGAGYTDVPTSSSCRRAVDWARDHGLLAVLADGATFGPGRTIKRGEAVAILHRLAGVEAAWGPGATLPPGIRFDPGA